MDHLDKAVTGAGGNLSKLAARLRRPVRETVRRNLCVAIGS
jgi:hypothetical protein